MIVFPNAKINLGLNILRKRLDGYHELETCFYPIKWLDALEVVESVKTEVNTSGIEIPNDGDNIILKAYDLLKEDFDLPQVNIHLHKSIPIGAGLGGGSSDAAFMLQLLNDQFSLSLNNDELKRYAVKLGADCAFFLENRPVVASGIGEVFTNVNVSLQDKHIVLVYPKIHISTKEAYAAIQPKYPKESICNILQNYQIDEWKDSLQNDFEEPLFKRYPVLKDIKYTLYDDGAVYASMSGSGSCLYGIFNERTELNYSNDYILWSGRL